MRSHDVKRGFTLIELLVVIAIIAILASLLFPVFARAREKARQTTCLSQQRQIATAALMYVQDNNGKFPGYTWSDAIQQYLSSTKMYVCPSSNDNDGSISYGYNGALVQYNGDGVSEAMCGVPTEIGLTADATPAKTSGNGGLIVGGGGQPITGSTGAGTAVNPDPRHSKGLIMSFVDGHAKYLPDGFDEKNLANTVTRAFFLASTYGMLNNPGGGLAKASTPAIPAAPAVTLTDVMMGGDSAVAPILQAAMKIYEKEASKSVLSRGFYGLNYIIGRPTATVDWVWGAASEFETPADAAKATLTQFSTSYTAQRIGWDAMVFIVAKNTKLNTGSATANVFRFEDQSSTKWGTYVVNTGQIAYMFGANTGITANTFTAYTLARARVDNGANKEVLRQGGLMYFMAKVLGVSPTYTNCLAAIGSQAIDVTDELDMVDKVANDPYGIGYCSAAAADPDRVTVLAIATDRVTTNTYTDATAAIDAATGYVFPRKNIKYRYFSPAVAAEPQAEYPFYRPMYVFGSQANMINNVLAPAGPTMQAVYAGPIFKAAFWQP